MSVEIPWSRIASISAPRPVLFSGNQEGALGGPTLPISRMGDRFAIDVRTTQLRQDSESRLLIAALTEATTADARIAIKLPNAPALTGVNAAVVDGANQSGMQLKLRALSSGASIPRGYFFSVLHGGVHFVYMAAAAVTAGGDGKVTLPIWPMLRFLTTDGEICALANPMIEGQLVGFDGRGATFTRARTDPMSFSIVERA